jgi:hypothetical protein
MNTLMAIKNEKKAISDWSKMAFGLLFYKNKYDDCHQSIHSIQNLALSSIRI